jgi:EAL domain-containing protein (putative c-di-GMP-specific phosphodiesterase class I)
MDLLREVFESLRREGIKVALDDFGTGFSSIGVLREINIDTIKVDREYVKNVEQSSADQNTIQSISNLADAFSAEVCVEGVETAGMRDYLRKYSVTTLQGYYYSKPISIDKFLNKYL